MRHQQFQQWITDNTVSAKSPQAKCSTLKNTIWFMMFDISNNMACYYFAYSHTQYKECISIIKKNVFEKTHVLESLVHIFTTHLYLPYVQLGVYMILHILEVLYQKMEEHVRMWNPEYRRPEVLSLD
jgi:hypothetical protein